MNPIRNGGRQDLLSLHLDVVLPRPRASISVTALRFSHREVLEQERRVVTLPNLKLSCQVSQPETQLPGCPA